MMRGPTVAGSFTTMPAAALENTNRTTGPRMPRLIGQLLLTTLLAMLAGGCATRTAATDRLEFVVVRHAEKADDGSRDPPLSAAGEVRARALAAALDHAPLHAAYATAYRRTQATAAPAARAHGVAVATYDASRAAADFVAQLRREHRDGTVLVVGHSNTVPAIAAALCDCQVTAMGDDEFDRLLTITIDADGHATLHEGRY